MLKYITLFPSKFGLPQQIPFIYIQRIRTLHCLVIHKYAIVYVTNQLKILRKLAFFIEEGNECIINSSFCVTLLTE